MTFECPQRMMPGTDVWEVRADGKQHCSYCGSLHPDDVLARLKAGEKATPTDKNYKLYIGGHEKFYFQHFNAEQKQAFVDLYNERIGADENAGMQLDVPGYFYVLPFFMSYRRGDE